ncbi:site-specific recombinase XerD [Gillisia sp. Hel_I_86]|uniref:tyrosine-type recombinase/integrase n=1 Tax=Gillisia sp. Hel_I_86 TaxID=1249981 RepID=UPI00119921D0|nr:tyrosine-type recombinase/integrase [Gillisia sp. Hel_I_86]TVZ26793.1 site-specific recombinase XerD [Gillisia sp. Hel_I_86]
MRTIKNLKGKVRFAFKESIKNLKESPKKESLIFLHFSYGGGKRFKYSTGYKSCYNDWNYEKQRIKTTKAGILNADEVNEYFSNLEIYINKQFSRLIAEGEVIKKSQLRNLLDEFTNKNTSLSKSSDLNFLQFTDYFFSLKEKEIKIVTLRTYKQTVRLLKEYSAKKNEELNFLKFDKAFYNNFTHYLKERSYKVNTIGKHIGNLKTILKSAEYEGIQVNQRFKARDFKAKSELTKAIYLNPKEIESIRNKDLSKYDNLERARDIFLIGYYTGQRVSDYNGLTRDDIVNIDGVYYFEIKQKKTGKLVHCPITVEIREIMKRYGDNPPPKMPDQKINEYIKQVGQMVNINDKIFMDYIENGKKKKKPESKFNLIATHTARRSFCTNKYREKMSIYDIMYFSGHSTEKEFRKYIRISKQDRATHIATSGFFNL